MTVDLRKAYDQDSGPRQLVDIALSSGRRFQSPQTGFVHYNYSVSEEERHDVAPVVDNFLWVLTLFRVRTADAVNEGKGVLERLLCYQDTTSDTPGNFPFYLHELPHCKDRYLAFHLLAPCYWMLREYGQVIGSGMQSALHQATERMLTYCLDAAETYSPPYHMLVKLGAAASAFGALWDRKDLAEKGSALLQEQKARGVTQSWFCPDQLGDILVNMLMLPTDSPDSMWPDLWKHLGDVWHRPTCSYIGPGLSERQRSYEPQSTVLDIVMGHVTNSFSYRAFDVHPYQLQACLVHNLDTALPTVNLPHVVVGEFKDKNGNVRAWRVFHGPTYAYSVIAQEEPAADSQQYRVHPVRVVWGDSNKTHSFSLQGGTVQALTFDDFVPDALTVHCKLPETVNPEDKEAAKELCLYFDRHDTLKKTVAGKAATTFELGQDIAVESDQLTVSCRIEADSPDGQFAGHIRPGNRPAQMCRKGADRFEAFDEEVMVRCVARDKSLDLKLAISFAAS